jgi:hypothetical protein
MITPEGHDAERLETVGRLLLAKKVIGSGETLKRLFPLPFMGLEKPRSASPSLTLDGYQ